MMPSALGLPVAVVLIATLIATVTDVWKFKIYNALTVPVLLLGLGYHAVTGGLAGLGNSALGMLFGFAILVIFYAMGGMGAGDVKLMAAVGAWLGMPMTCFVFIASSLAAGAYAVLLLLVSGGMGEVYVNFHVLFYRLAAICRHLAPDARVETEVSRPDRRKRLIPFAGMMAIGVVATLIWLRQQSSP